MVTRKMAPILMGIRKNVDVDSRCSEANEWNCREWYVDSLMIGSGMTVHGKEYKHGVLYGARGAAGNMSSYFEEVPESVLAPSVICRNV